MSRDETQSKYKDKSVKLPKRLHLYNDMDYLSQMKAHFFYKLGIAFSALMIILILGTYYVQVAYLPNGGSFVLILEIACLALSMFSTLLLTHGSLTMPIHYLLITSFIFLWVTIFYETESIVARLDSIAFTFAILSLTPLITENKRNYIGIYYLANILILTAFSVYIVLSGQVACGDAVEYYLDNLITYIFLAIASYNIYTIYNNSIARSETALSEAQKAKEEIKLMNEELEIKVEERTAELNNAILLIEESNTELYKLNQEMTKKADSMMVTNEKLALSENNLIKMNAEKDKFFSLIAHDLKNPFVALINNAELLLEYYGELDDEKKKSLIKGMKDASQSTYSLLENLLEWSRAQRGLITFAPEEFNVFIISHSSIDALNLTLSNKGIELTNNIPLGLYIEADKNLFTTVIRNLVSNAIKFTPAKGTIEINALEKENVIQFSVTDSGVGMSVETLNKLFKIDIQVTTKGTAGEKGTGLGLLLCKEFVEMHGGRIWVESELGNGSTFYFTLPK